MQVDELSDGVYHIELTEREDTIVAVVAQVTHSSPEEVIEGWLCATIEIHKDYDKIPRQMEQKENHNGKEGRTT